MEEEDVVENINRILKSIEGLKPNDSYPATAKWISVGKDIASGHTYDTYTVDSDGLGLTVADDLVATKIVKDWTPYISSDPCAAEEEHRPIRNADRFGSPDAAAVAFREKYPEVDSDDDVYDWSASKLNGFIEWLFEPNGECVPWFASNSVSKTVKELLETADTLEPHDKTITTISTASPAEILRGDASAIQHAYDIENVKVENRILGECAMAVERERSKYIENINELEANVDALESALRAVSKTLVKYRRGGGCSIPAFEFYELSKTVADALQGKGKDDD